MLTVAKRIIGYAAASFFCVLSFAAFAFAECTPASRIQTLSNQPDATGYMAKTPEERLRVLKTYPYIIACQAIEQNHAEAKKLALFAANVKKVLGNKALKDLPILGENPHPPATSMETHIVYLEDAIWQLTQLAVHSFLGQYIPKNDNNAIRYMRLLVDLMKEKSPIKGAAAEPFFFHGIMRESQRIGSEASIHNSYDRMSLATDAIMLKAGHKKTTLPTVGELMVVSMQKNDKKYFSRQLKKLAAQGDLQAIEMLKVVKKYEAEE